MPTGVTEGRHIAVVVSGFFELFSGKAEAAGGGEIHSAMSRVALDRIPQWWSFGS